MRKPCCGLAPEGMPFLFLATLATVVFALAGWVVLSLVGLGVVAFILNFFRDPERVVPQEKGVVVAPADGRVVRVAPMPDPVHGTPRMAVCIFMNVFNVHVNRTPVAGVVRQMRYIPGKFFNASLDKASTDNERCIMDLEAEDGSRFTVVQIAGLIARRIVDWVRPGDALPRGVRFGMIRFGSRVDLYLPLDYEPSIQEGERTVAGQTVVARKREPLA
ncbi:MAG: phosphatidylserine decarboxylase [Desulfomicrobiaceae bacterium]|jgi:phosphatidylserine decarboxylase|nr:phosphatidylserine decarboxylase [Desulfomicrobiaceae bacterium]